jgi:hypothetical protein
VAWYGWVAGMAMEGRRERWPMTGWATGEMAREGRRERWPRTGWATGEMAREGSTGDGLGARRGSGLGLATSTSRSATA